MKLQALSKPPRQVDLQCVVERVPIEKNRTDRPKSRVSKWVWARREELALVVDDEVCGGVAISIGG